jgi:hypothetical protein
MRAGVYPPLSEEDGMPTLAAGLPPDGRHTIHIDEGEEWLRKTLDELRALQSVLAPPKRRSTVQQLPPPAPERSRWVPSWWKLGTAGSIASLVGVPLAVAVIVLAVAMR